MSSSLLRACYYPHHLRFPSSTQPPKLFLTMNTLTHNAHPLADGEAPLKTVNVRVKGRVQGVFYRNWTVETARQLGLNGWVRNRRDGTVEALLSGKPADVDSMIEQCRRGPSAARVSGVEVNPSNETVSKGFERRYTE
eukprot:c22935_g1_i2 orf=101-514(+)